MYRLLGQVLLVLSIATLGLTGCATAQPSGERFGIATVGRNSVPELATANLVSDDKKIFVSGVNAGKSYHQNDGIRIPEEVEFSWRAKGENEYHLEKMKVRSRIPEAILRLLQTESRTHHMRIEFLVIHGTPRLRWELRQIDSKGNGATVARGGE